MYKKAVIDPWVGRHYESGGIIGLRIMLLGESMYSREGQTRGHIQSTIEAVINGEWRLAFFTRIMHSILQENAVLDDYEGFWNSVLFSNYLQQLFPQPRVLPQNPDWARAREAFTEIIEAHRPHCIIALSSRLWNQWLPKDLGRVGTVLSLSDGTPLHTRRYSVSANCEALAFNTTHPSSGFSIDRFRPLISTGISEARRLNTIQLD